MNTLITKIEFIEVTITTTSADASDLEVVLTSPSGSSSTLAEAHVCSSGANTNPINSAPDWCHVEIILVGYSDQPGILEKVL
ncbi:MAG: proprotein convertase P-domain-containing protein [Leptospiraceae bacterium]|nr:proprotein convertase P-domain-containing protein [Leptospiraceae bacterium]